LPFSFTLIFPNSVEHFVWKTLNSVIYGMYRHFLGYLACDLHIFGLNVKNSY
jgi:hypothetical protein